MDKLAPMPWLLAGKRHSAPSVFRPENLLREALRQKGLPAEAVYFVLIDQALRDEGASHHYLPPSDRVDADPALADAASATLSALDVTVRRGLAWTTDAPYRETEAAIAQAREAGALAVEMEAAALYAFAAARSRPVICFAHVTNRMAQVEGDFEKGADDGSRDALAVIAAAARAWRGLSVQDHGKSDHV